MLTKKQSKHLGNPSRFFILERLKNVKMPKKSAGILLYRFDSAALQVFLVHPGGPFWKNKDLGSWSIPKGEFGDDEPPLDAAIREFEEETGLKPDGNFIALTPVKMKSGKIIHCFALLGDFNPSHLKSNTFSTEWPPRSGLKADFPEVDKGEWFSLEDAMKKVNQSQMELINQLSAKLNLP